MERHPTLMNWKTYIVKMSRLLKARYRVITIPIKIPAAFFTEVEKLILQFIWSRKGPYIAKTILKKKKVGRLSLPSFKMQQNAIVFKAVWYLQKDRYMDL